jgi:hypothetical protein
LPRWTDTNFFPSRARHCPACSQRIVTLNDQPVTEYYHRGVVCHLIGTQIPVPLDLELIQPGEGEVPAARRLLERVFVTFPHFFDAVVGDGIYLEAPFVHFCLDHGKDVVAVLKDNNPALLEDARAVFDTLSPMRWQHGNGHVQFWDEEGFTSSENIRVPLRILHAREVETKRRRKAGHWVDHRQVHNWWWATTLSKKPLPTRALHAAAHGRWDIENDLFNDLVTHYGLDHCYKHHPVAIVALVLTLFIAFVLLKAFYHRNLKPPLRRLLTVIGLTGELYLGLAALNRQDLPAALGGLAPT